MAEMKKKKIKTKVESSTKSSVELDDLLNNMSKLALDKLTTGEVKIKIKKVDNVITKDELTVTGEVSVELQDLAKKAQEIATGILKDETDGEIKVVFETENETTT